MVLDPKEYTRIDLAELYRLRWQAEIDLRHLKTTMQMEHLPSKNAGDGCQRLLR